MRLALAATTGHAHDSGQADFRYWQIPSRLLGMKLTLETRVASSPQDVWAGFNEALFVQLAPPFPRIRLLKFEGSTTGCLVEVEINFLLFRQVWQSLIVEQGETAEAIWFVDEGRQLPFFLRYWRHRHVISAENGGARILDDIEFRSPSRILDILLYPSLWLQFAYRRPIYRRVFGKPAA